MHTADPFLFQLFFIFVWAKLFGEAFERMHLPAVLGEILAGVLLGPYGARLVVPTDAIYAIAGIGAIFLLFTVGLETQPKDLISVGSHITFRRRGGNCGAVCVRHLLHAAASPSAA